MFVWMICWNFVRIENFWVIVRWDIIANSEDAFFFWLVEMKMGEGPLVARHVPILTVPQVVSAAVGGALAIDRWREHETPLSRVQMAPFTIQIRDTPDDFGISATKTFPDFSSLFFTIALRKSIWNDFLKIEKRCPVASALVTVVFVVRFWKMLSNFFIVEFGVVLDTFKFWLFWLLLVKLTVVRLRG